MTEIGDLTVKNGHLHIAGVDTIELAEKYGTPLYVMSEDLIRKNCRDLNAVLKDSYGGNGHICFASKAFCTKRMCRIAAEENMGLDVVSGGELYTAHAAGFPMERVNFHGNNKTNAEIKLGIEYGVGRFVADNKEELIKIDVAAQMAGIRQKVILRVTPGVEAHTHDFIKTGQIDSKFGTDLETGAALSLIEFAQGMPGIELVGLHCHIGSQIFEIEPFIEAALVMLGFYKTVKERLGITFSELVLGGGFGIRYTEKDKPEKPADMVRTVLANIKEIAARMDVPAPSVGFEPGRSVVGEAGVTLYTVGNVKEIPNIRTYVSIDGGMTDNPRYALYGSEYELVAAERADAPKTELITLAGKCCESGDLIAKDACIQPVKPGDIVAVLSTGAYNYSMASNYNRIPRPAVVMVAQGKDYLSVKRETYEDIIRNDI